MYRTSRGKGFFLPWLTFHFLVKKIGFFLVKGMFSKQKLNFWVLHSVLCLGEGVNLHTEDSSPR